MEAKKVKLDLNNKEFQQTFLALGKEDKGRVHDTLTKIVQLDWNQLYRDKGLNWEKIVSVKPPKGIDALYSIRITKSRRAIAYRSGELIVFLSIEHDHDSTYGKK
jgi:hypothetical protein